MRVKVDRVYRDASGVQRCVDFTLSSGAMYNRPVDCFISRMRGSDYIAENFIIIGDCYLQGKGCDLEFVNLLTIDDIIERYPDKWVALRPFVMELSGFKTTHGVVRKVMNYAEYQEFRSKCVKDGTRDSYYFFRTTAPLSMGYGFGVV